jgi:hypothetical protein
MGWDHDARAVVVSLVATKSHCPEKFRVPTTVIEIQQIKSATFSKLID